MDQTDKEKWLEERRYGIGASDAPCVLGISPWKSALALYCEKLGITDPIEETEAMEWGHRLESVIAAKFEEEKHYKVINDGAYRIIWSDKYPYMHSTLDRTLVELSGDPEYYKYGVLEIKTAAASQEKYWEDEPPEYYQCQIQHQMVVTGYTWGYFAVLFGGQKFRYCRVEKNEKFCEYLIEKEKEFWSRVERQDPPPPDDSDSARQALKRLYSEPTGEIVELGGHFIDMDAELQAAKKDKATIERMITGIENEFLAAIGSATVGVLPNGTQYTLKEVKRSAYTVEETTYRQLRRKGVKDGK